VQLATIGTFRITGADYPGRARHRREVADMVVDYAEQCDDRSFLLVI
jgi:hypothetical protein